ncbi:hypothetical protein BS47DRAFT_644637 [Hydnum rufescens UP504]|uniref:Uncharacterized protein n=1 Tax=Hydnum rufescens UP504 TaxID=1448309 RepID=A0A9P6BB23_9AGAM|nr:hypothetical protein BS47DRAFT_644637 [Hydnum rufescens UP504]
METLNRMKQWNSQLNREKFDLEHRVRNLITQLGYRSLEHAEESQREESQAQTGAGPNSESALQARFNTALAKIEALEGAATSSFHRHKRELDLLERDVKRLLNEKTALEQRTATADSLLVYTKEEAQRMREEFDERLAIKEDILSELRSKMPLAPSNPPEAPSRSKENGLPMEIDTPLLPGTESDLPKVLHRLEFHHKELKTKYDVLLDEKRALARRFSNHIKQWKRFKVWYHTKYDVGDIDVSQLSTSAKKEHYRRLRDTHDEQGRTLPIIVTDLIHSAETDLSSSLLNTTSIPSYRA